MTPDQRLNAGRAVAARIREMRTTPSQVARAASIDPKTLRSVIRGEHWPSDAVQDRIEAVLRWSPGEIQTRSVRPSRAAVAGMKDSQLAAELTRRLVERERRESRLRGTDGPTNGNPFTRTGMSG